MKKYIYILVAAVCLMPLSVTAESIFNDDASFTIAASKKLGDGDDLMIQKDASEIGNDRTGSEFACQVGDTCGVSSCRPNENPNYVWNGTSCVNPCNLISCVSGFSKVLSSTGCCCK